MVKCVTAAGVAKYYEVGATTNTTSVTLRTAASVPLSGGTSWVAASISSGDFTGGKLFVCESGAAFGTDAAILGTVVTNGGAAMTAAQRVVTGYEIDGKGIVKVESLAP